MCLEKMSSELEYTFWTLFMVGGCNSDAGGGDLIRPLLVYLPSVRKKWSTVIF